MSKFKIGDRVKVKSRIPLYVFKEININSPELVEFIRSGGVFVVSDVSDDVLGICHDDNVWWVTSEMCSLVK